MSVCPHLSRWSSFQILKVINTNTNESRGSLGLDNGSRQILLYIRNYDMEVSFVILEIRTGQVNIDGERDAKKFGHEGVTK